MFTKLLSGFALAATFAIPQVVSAGHGCCPCPGYAPAAISSQPAVTSQQTAAPRSAVQPPIASGEGGRVIRRFTYEPGTPPAPQATAAPAYQSAAPFYRSAAPTYRSSQPTRMGRSVGGLTGEARLRPGRGR